jgi:hypothetical protein
MSEYTHCIQCNCYFCCFIFYFPLRGYLFEFFVPIFSRLYLLLFSFDSQCQKRFFFFFRSLLIVPYEKGSSPCMRSFTIFCRNFKNEKGMSVALQSSVFRLPTLFSHSLPWNWNSRRSLWTQSLPQPP